MRTKKKAGKRKKEEKEGASCLVSHFFRTILEEINRSYA